MHRCLTSHRLKRVDRRGWLSQEIGESDLEATALIHAQDYRAWSLVAAQHSVARPRRRPINGHDILHESKDHPLRHGRTKPIEHKRLVERDDIGRDGIGILASGAL